MLHVLTAALAATPELAASELTDYFDTRARAVADTPLADMHLAASAGMAPTAVTTSSAELITDGSAQNKLIYMALRGLGDLPHLVVDYYGLPFVMLHVGAADMKTLKPMLP